MIVLNFSPSNNYNLKNKIYKNEYNYPDILRFIGKFQIKINGSVFFSDSYFPILEFLKDALAWIDCSDKLRKMEYSSIETDDNPLIVFLKKDKGWILRSPWQKFECNIYFNREDFENAILNLKNMLK